MANDTKRKSKRKVDEKTEESTEESDISTQESDAVQDSKIKEEPIPEPKKKEVKTNVKIEKNQMSHFLIPQLFSHKKNEYRRVFGKTEDCPGMLVFQDCTLNMDIEEYRKGETFIVITFNLNTGEVEFIRDFQNVIGETPKKMAFFIGTVPSA